MISLNVRNVNDGLSVALSTLFTLGSERPSRNGPVLAFSEPVATTYSHPTERVLFSPLRNANPTFHLMEALWMIAGRNDVAFPATFVKNMRNYSDDDKTFWGAYGYRWRNFFGWDQIAAAITELRTNPQSRRVVVSMWNGMGMNEARGNGPSWIDAHDPDFIVGQTGGKDVPCNTHIYFDRRDGNLNMTVCCRSNDIIWGCYGANAVHMSFLQEYMAAAIDCPVGWYTQISNDLHMYLNNTSVEKARALSREAWEVNGYRRGWVTPTPLLSGEEIIEDLADDIETMFFVFDKNKSVHAILDESYETRFMYGTVVPMLQAWLYRKTPASAEEACSRIQGLDWKAAMFQWVGGVQAGLAK